MEFPRLNEPRRAFHNRCPLRKLYHTTQITDLGHSRQESKEPDHHMGDRGLNSERTEHEDATVRRIDHGVVVTIVALLFVPVEVGDGLLGPAVEHARVVDLSLDEFTERAPAAQSARVELFSRGHAVHVEGG